MKTKLNKKLNKKLVVNLESILLAAFSKTESKKLKSVSDEIIECFKKNNLEIIRGDIKAGFDFGKNNLWCVTITKFGKRILQVVELNNDYFILSF